MAKQVVIVDLKVVEHEVRHINNGVLYCGLIDHETGERIIQADIEYVMKAVKERGYEVVDAQDVLYKISQNYQFLKKAK